MTIPCLPQFVAAGEALTDLIAQDGAADTWCSRVGGAAWNVARVLARLGVPSAFAGAISQEHFGQQLWDASQAAGLDTRFLQRYAKSPLLAVVYSTHPPRYAFVGDDSADLYFAPERLPSGWQTACQWAHFGGISLAREPLAARLVVLAETLKAAGVRISFDPNFRNLMDERFDATLQRMTAVADVVKVSDEDLCGLFRTSDQAQAFAQLRQWNPQATYLYTRGADGASLHQGNQTWSAAALRVNVVDTVGAGDASMGGLIYSLMQQPQAKEPEHLRWALACGAAACMAAGASPPSLEQVRALLAA